MVKKTIAIIPARGGSKRIPNKNIIDFFGKPLIAYTIESALKTNLFDKIIVSTDSPKIASISKKFGADVPFLREKHNDDYSNVSQVTTYVLEELYSRYKIKYETVVQLMPNCPIRSHKEILLSYKNFISNNYDFQISCFKFGYMNPWWALKKHNENYDFLFPDTIKKRSQDLEDLYCPTGAIWIAKTKELIKTKSFYSKPLNFFPINWKAALDIDNYDDLEMAKSVFLMKKSTKQLTTLQQKQHSKHL